VSADTVTASDPKDGTQVVVGTKVRINISSGPTPVAVPDVRGQPISQATSTLNGLGFKVNATYVDSTEPQNSVVEQSPAANASAAKGSTVSLTVSNGPKSVAVPDVRNLDVGSATSTLQNAGFRVKFSYTTVTDPNQDQIVLDQNPEGGGQAKPGATVTLVVGRCGAGGCVTTSTAQTTTTTP
jgi:eukaryotic-like serine/threonine-protein kinase